ALSVGRSSRAVFGEAVSGGYFATIGVTPRLGRLIDATDEAAAAHVVVISEGFWRAALDRDPAAVGRTVRLGGSAFDGVGVVSGHFHGLDRFVPATFWVPATALRNNPERFELSSSAFDRRGQGAFAVWGRLVPGVPVTRFASEVAVIGQQFDVAYPPWRANTTRDWSASAGAIDPLASDALRSIVTMIVLALAVVLLIACTNLANL